MERTPTPPRPSWRPTLIGKRYAIACGHYLPAAAAARILERGGNAIDAGVAAAMALAIVQPDIVSFNFKLLDDDMALQPAQNILGVATQELADAAPDDFAETINAINAALTTEVLTQLGVEIVVDQTDMAEVATNFLEDNGLL